MIPAGIVQTVNSGVATPTGLLLPESFQNAVYGPTVTINLSAGNVIVLTVTNANAFQIANPIQVVPGAMWWLNIRNASGGAHGAGTWGTNFRVPGNVPAIANGQNRWFQFWAGAMTQRELFRSAADIPN